MGLSNRDEMYTSLSGDVRGIFSESLKLIHPAVQEEMRNTQIHRQIHRYTEGARQSNKNIDISLYCISLLIYYSSLVLYFFFQFDSFLRIILFYLFTCAIIFVYFFKPFGSPLLNYQWSYRYISYLMRTLRQVHQKLQILI